VNTGYYRYVHEVNTTSQNPAIHATTMTKRSYTIAFKKEVVEYMSLGHSAYKAKHFFSSRDNFEYDPSMFRHWYKKKEALCCEESAQKKRLSGGGRKPATKNANATSINDVNINASGSLLFSSKFLGNDGAAKVQLILASQSPRRAGNYVVYCILYVELFN
jgi:hypothetical protein